jgi:hypothetical protein
LYFTIFILSCCSVIAFIYACILGSKLSIQETLNLLLDTNYQKVKSNNQELINIINDMINIKPYPKFWEE